MPSLFFFFCCSFVIDLHPSFASGTGPFVTRFGSPTSEPQHIPGVGTTRCLRQKNGMETLSSTLVDPKARVIDKSRETKVPELGFSTRDSMTCAAWLIIGAFPNDSSPSFL